MGFENSFRAGTLALSMATGLGGALGMGLGGCGDGDSQGDAHLAPLASPSPSDTTRTDPPFNSCFSPNYGMAITMDGRNASWSGGSVMAIDRESLSYLSGKPAGEEWPNNFRAIANWDSVPLELNSFNPDKGPIGLLGARTNARLGGFALNHQDMTREGMTGTWAAQFPGFMAAAQLGFIWLIEGDLDPDCQQLHLIMRGAFRSPNGVSAAQPYVTTPMYSKRADGRTRLAEATFSNEGLAILTGALEVTFHLSGSPESGWTSDPAVICDNNCKTIMGSSLEHLEAQIVAKPKTTPVGPGDAGTDASHVDAGVDSGDGGIPPLSPPDAGMEGG